MANYFVQASQDERGKYTGGEAGDQSLNEVAEQVFYSYPWEYMAIPKDATERKQIVKLAKQAAKNNYIGYDQGNRNSLMQELKKHDLDFTKVNPCECDCSSLVHAVLYVAGSVPEYQGNAATTRTLKKLLDKSGSFDIITDQKKINQSKYATAGAVYWKPGAHAAICIKDGSAPMVKEEKNYTRYAVGEVYEIIAKLGLRVRKGPGISYARVPYVDLTADARKHAKINGTLLAGTKVTCKEIYLDGSHVWIRIPSGWICAEQNGDEYIR